MTKRDATMRVVFRVLVPGPWSLALCGLLVLAGCGKTHHRKGGGSTGPAGSVGGSGGDAGSGGSVESAVGGSGTSEGSGGTTGTGGGSGGSAGSVGTGGSGGGGAGGGGGSGESAGSGGAGGSAGEGATGGFGGAAGEAGSGGSTGCGRSGPRTYTLLDTLAFNLSMAQSACQSQGLVLATWGDATDLDEIIALCPDTGDVFCYTQFYATGGELVSVCDGGPIPNVPDEYWEPGYPDPDTFDGQNVMARAMTDTFYVTLQTGRPICTNP